MLKKDTLAKMAKHLKIDLPALEAAIASLDEQDVPIADDLQVFTKAELTLRDGNTYKTAKTAGEEMLIKALKTKHAIDSAGEDPEAFVAAVIKKAGDAANANPDVRIAEKDKEIEKVKKALKASNDLADQLRVEKETLQGDTELLSILPADRIESMTNAEFLTLTKSALKIETKDGKKVVVKNGEVVVDPKTQEPIPVTDAIKGYFTERKWIKEAAPAGPSGRGGGNSSPSAAARKYAKMSDAREAVIKEHGNIHGEKGTAALQAIIKENPEMDFNN